MKKPFLLIIALVLVAAVDYYLLYDHSGKIQRQQDQPLALAENTDPFNRSFDELLKAYFELKDALVESDSLKADQTAVKLIKAADNLNVAEIKGDSTGTIVKLVRELVMSIDGSCNGLIGEKGLSAKRIEFEMISDVIYNLARTVRFTGRTIYYQHCPMAFDNRGAYWLSNERAIRNPYFGRQMLTCGTVDDSLGFTTGTFSK